MPKYTYTIITPTIGPKIILRSDGACIPTSLANFDYVEYLESLDEAAPE